MLSDKELLKEMQDKSEDNFDKNILYISAGTLALTITFLEKIVNVSKAIKIELLGRAWLFLTLTLLINLYSHWHSALVARMMSKKHDDLTERRILFPEYLRFYKKNNNILHFLNIGNIITLITGLGFLLYFCYSNTLNMSKDNIIPKTYTDIIEKGRTMHYPTPPVTQPAPTTTPPPAPAPVPTTPVQSGDQ